MSLGLVCHFLRTRTKSNGKIETYNAMEERSLQLGRWKSKKYTDNQIFGVYLNNVTNLAKMAPVIGKHSKCFRISSSLFPLADKIDRSLWDNKEIKEQLTKAGELFKQSGVRLTMHPGQFCVLSSDTDSVIKNAIADLEIHAWIMDALGAPRTPYSAINIHGGKSKASQRLIQSINDLPESIQSRLTLENDETSYSVLELLEIHKKSKVPIVFDSHHHIFNSGDLTMNEAFDAACATWPRGINPLQHLSNTEPGLENGSFMDRRKHSNYLHQIPEPQHQALVENKIDLECEAKMKNFAIDNLRKLFNLKV